MDPSSLGPDVLAPGTVLGRYEIRRLIGRGGMGSVYEGLHRDLKKRVAIKTLQAALAANPDAKVRFLREGEAASRIRHPHVVDVTDVGAEGAVIFLVMEYLEGEDLGKLIGRQGAMEVSATADIMLPVIAAIGSAHDQGVIHRDLKPENIFLARGQMGGIQPKVLDFGISKVSGDLRTMALTGTGATFGTTFYLPPEQLRGAKQADARSDQYALGTIIYECLTGQRAFEGDNLYAVLKDIAESRYRPAVTLRPDLPPALDAIVNRAMNLEPSTRFETTRHLGAALLEFASPQVRMVWTPFFATQPWPGQGDAPALVDSYGSGPLTPPPPSHNLAPLTPPPDASGSPSSRHLRATPPPTDPPRASAGGTRVLPSGSTPFPRAASASGGGRRMESSSTFNHATGESASFESMQPARSRLPLVVGLGVLVAVGVVFLVMRPDQSSDRTTTPAVVPEPKTYRVEVVTDPGSATIELDGQLVGTGAFARKLPLDGTEHEIVAKARGHRNASVRFTDVAPARDLVLEAIAVVEPPKPPPPPVAGDSDGGKSGDRNDRPGIVGKTDKTGKGGKSGGKSGGGKSGPGHHGSAPGTGPAAGDSAPSGNPSKPPGKPAGKAGKAGDTGVLPNNAPIVD